MVRFGIYLARKVSRVLFLMVGVSLIVFTLYRYFWQPALINTPDDLFLKAYWERGYRILMTPFFVGYIHFSYDIIRGDWGWSLLEGLNPVWDIIIARLPFTLGLSFAALILMMCMGVPLGIFAVVKRGTRMGNVLEFIIQLCSSSPIFFIALLLPYILYYTFSSWGLPLLPLVSYGNPSIFNFILPVITIAVVGTGIMAKYARVAARQILEQDYIKAGEMKGLPRMSIIAKHALKNILVFPQSALVSILSVLLVGIIFAEYLFDLPGLGQFLVRSMISYDLDSMFGLILFFSFTFIIISFFTDILRYFLDPRLRRPPANESLPVE
jgi:peptide/nickel transport system permease protein